MKPQLFGYETYFLFWAVAAVLDTWSGMRLTRQAGFPAAKSFAALCALSVAIFLGSKLQYVVEHALFPADDPVPMGQNALGLLMWHGFRIPGGVLLSLLALPLICKLVGLPALRFGDAVAPTVGIGVACIRVGCLLNGCCFGRVTTFPIAMTFPPGARVFEWQQDQGLLSATATHSLPVHPLQIYFGLLGVLMYSLGRRRQKHKRFDGDVVAHCTAVFFGGTFFLELLRPEPFHLNLIVTFSVAATALLITLRARAAAPAAARVAS